VSLINTINSITAINLDDMAPEPTVDGKGTHGGYCGPAVKPIALHMVAEIARSPDTQGLPISASAGSPPGATRRVHGAVAGTVQVCTAAMHYGFKIVDDMVDGARNWMDGKGYKTDRGLPRRAVPNVTDWQYLNINYKTVAAIDQDKCIKLRPLPHRVRGHLAPGDRGDAGQRQAALRGDRRGVRRLQPVHACVPGAGMHHHGARRDGKAVPELDAASEQSDAEGGGIKGIHHKDTKDTKKEIQFPVSFPRSGNPGPQISRLPWIPAFAGVTMKEGE
jgi:dihydropyrimidine dehydrogenase (NAD+) subunit PreA